MGMLSKLKTDCGGGSVSKIIKMKNDIEESKQEMNDHKEYKKKINFITKIDFNAKILTGGCWPEF